MTSRCEVVLLTADRPRKPKGDNWDVKGAPHEILQQASNQNPSSFRVIQGPYDMLAQQRWQFDQMQPIQPSSLGLTYRNISHSMSRNYPAASIPTPFTLATISNDTHLVRALEDTQSADQRYATNSGVDTLYETPHPTQSYAVPSETGHGSYATGTPSIEDYNNHHNMMHANSYSGGVSDGGNYMNGVYTGLASATGPPAVSISNPEMISVGQGWAPEH